MYKQNYISSTFTRNSEAFASNFTKVVDSTCTMISIVTTSYCAIVSKGLTQEIFSNSKAKINIIK